MGYLSVAVGAKHCPQPLVSELFLSVPARLLYVEFSNFIVRHHVEVTLGQGFPMQAFTADSFFTYIFRFLFCLAVFLV